MIFINFLILLTNCLLIYGASLNTWENDLGKITGGHNVAPSAHPYLISLQIKLFRVRSHICGGTLLNHNWVLSAAHCVKGSFLIRWLTMEAIAGASTPHDLQSTNFGPHAQIAVIDKRIPHPSYLGGIGPNDIAVLHTATAFKFTKEVRPALLPINFKMTKDPLVLTGWGVLKTTFFFPDLPRELQEVDVTYIPYRECHNAIEAIKDRFEKNPLDEKANICTGPITGGISACSGDSGGPLIQLVPKLKVKINDDEDTTTEGIDNYDNFTENNVIEDRSGDDIDTHEYKDMPIVLGVVSWGASPCGDKGAPSVYTKVETYLDFINQHINN